MGSRLSAKLPPARAAEGGLPQVAPFGVGASLTQPQAFHTRTFHTRTLHTHSLPQALTATAKWQVQKDILASLCLEHARQIRLSVDRPNLFFEVVLKDHIGRPAFDDLRDFVKAQVEEGGGRTCGIIYAHKRDQCDSLAEMLSRYGEGCESRRGGAVPSRPHAR